MGNVSGPGAKGSKVATVRRTVAKKGPGIFVECGKVKLGQQLDWTEYRESQLLKMTDAPEIGLWGVVQKDNMPLKDIAVQVYGDDTMSMFIAHSNKITGKTAFKGERLFIPNITHNIMTEFNETVKSNYTFTFPKDMPSVVQQSGDYYTPCYQAGVRLYAYRGSDHNSVLVSTDQFTYDDYKAMMNFLTKASIHLYKLYDKSDAYIDLAKNLHTFFKSKDWTYVDIRFREGVLKYRIRKDLKSMEINSNGARWVSRAELTKNLFKNSFSKRFIVVTVIIAGWSTWVDYQENHNIGHAALRFGIEVGKAVLATALACAAVALLPVSASAAVIFGVFFAVSFGASLLFDAIDENIQKSGDEKGGSVLPFNIHINGLPSPPPC